ncbi:hypothetical protein FRC12_016733 [Ceratobasidium sp. 428]|nr:hypothetical protein FRC12_016733 [Ceratobasidium sp. 428]
MQTSPQVVQYLPTFSQRDRYYTPPSSSHIDSSSSYRVGSPAGHDMGSPPSQHVVSSIARDASAFSSPAGFQMQFHPPQASPQRPQERQAFAIPFQHEQPTAPEVFPASLAHQQQSQQFTTQHYREHSHEQYAYEPRTPASTAPSSFYDSPPTQQPVPSQSQQLYQYASSNYNQGRRYGSSQYQGDAHTDTESVYAYSEGANVMPSRYGDQMQVPPPPRSDIQAPYGRGTESLAYPGEDVGRGGVGREWEKTSRNTTRR